MIWCCPHCHGQLAWDGQAVRCVDCERYEVLAGIPDIRLDARAWIDFADDLERARELIDAVPPKDVAGSVTYAFRRRGGWDQDLADRRVRQVMKLPERLRGELDEWLAPLRRSGPLLDIGCGPGTLLAAAGATEESRTASSGC